MRYKVGEHTGPESHSDVYMCPLISCTIPGAMCILKLTVMTLRKASIHLSNDQHTDEGEIEFKNRGCQSYQREAQMVIPATHIKYGYYPRRPEERTKMQFQSSKHTCYSRQTRKYNPHLQRCLRRRQRLVGTRCRVEEEEEEVLSSGGELIKISGV